MRFFRRNERLRGNAVIRFRQFVVATEDEFEREPPHVMELEINLPGRTPYRVRDTFRVPFEFSDVAEGMELPALVDPANPQSVTIDWRSFKAGGGDERIRAQGNKYGHDAARRVLASEAGQRQAARDVAEQWLGAVASGQMSLHDFESGITENAQMGLLSRPEADALMARARMEPGMPSVEAHPPVEGVDFEAFLAATAEIVRNKVKPAGHEQVYQAHGFPPGRSGPINVAWYERIQRDEQLRQAYLRATTDHSP